MDFSPTSPDSTTPPTERRFSPGKGTPFAPDSPRQIDLGMTILVTRHRGMSRGIVRYVGKLPDKGSKVYVGIELFGKGNILTLSHGILSVCQPQETLESSKGYGSTFLSWFIHKNLSSNCNIISCSMFSFSNIDASRPQSCFVRSILVDRVDCIGCIKK